MKLGTLLTIHQALDFTKRNCGTKGLVYVDAQIDIEEQIRVALARNETPRYADQRKYLAKLLETGTICASD